MRSRRHNLIFGRSDERRKEFYRFRLQSGELRSGVKIGRIALTWPPESKDLNASRSVRFSSSSAGHNSRAATGAKTSTIPKKEEPKEPGEHGEPGESPLTRPISPGGTAGLSAAGGLGQMRMNAKKKKRPPRNNRFRPRKLRSPSRPPLTR